MKCNQCQHNNGEGARYCEKCGARIQLICPECDMALGPQAKFCDNCGINLRTLKANNVSEELYKQESFITNDAELDKDKAFYSILERLAKGEISAETADQMLQLQSQIKRPSKITGVTNSTYSIGNSEILYKSKIEEEPDHKPYVIHSIKRKTKKGSYNTAHERLKAVTNSWRKAQNSD